MINKKFRPSGRNLNDIRFISLENNVIKHAEGSCLVKFGDTHVLCTATVKSSVPFWLKGKGIGWITAEYGMLPRSTNTRMYRESVLGKQCGRTQEIQRLIGRSLRAIVDLKILGERQIIIDCDVLQADGGTRTASITGSWIALYYAIKWINNNTNMTNNPIIDHVAAISCGIYNDKFIIDLDYEEDSKAVIDANFVLTGKGNIVEIQCAAETRPFSEKEFINLLNLAKCSIQKLVDLQKKIII